jgi:hypothetical protein
MWSLLMLALGFLLGRALRTPREGQSLEGSTILRGGLPPTLRGQFCEGSYDCITPGSIYQAGDRTTIGFYQVETCPPNTTLGDGSSWRLRPGTCNC